MSKRMLGSEIELLRKTLKMSEAEFAAQIGLDDRRTLKLLETGKDAPSPIVRRGLFKLLTKFSGRFPKLKKLKEQIDARSQQW